MSNFVFVLDANKQPLDPVHPGQARRWLTQGRAAIFRRYPFTIILKQDCHSTKANSLKLKIDPGSKVTGLALIQGKKVVWGAELQHRGQQIKDALEFRRRLRRGRRNRKTRYRQPRFLNRHRTEGWLAPSLQHRVETVITWVNRLCRYAPIASISQELVRFDTQALQNPEIAGAEYQQGELQGYEVKEYLLIKWNYQCVYCRTKDVPLEIEHIQARSRGGSDRVSNLTLACSLCNRAKGTQSIEDFLVDKPDLLNQILTQAKRPFKDAAAINSTRWALFDRLRAIGLPVELSTGGRTKYNRYRLGLPKAHWLDAACVGTVETLQLCTTQPLLIKATGHGNRQMCGTNKYGFPIRHRTRQKIHKGFQTGDVVKAVVTSGKKIGVYTGRVLTRALGSFDISLRSGRVTGISYRFCKRIHRKDGYSYEFQHLTV